MTIELEAPVRTVGLTINAPAVFARPDFMAWLNDPANKVFTWHDKASPVAGEYGDVVVLVDSGYEGDGSNMPDHIWHAICDAAYAEYGGSGIPQAGGSHVTVRLTNLAS